MLALDYWKAVTTDQSRFLDRIVTLLSESGFRKCIIGGQAVNAYVEPVVSLDLAVAVAASDLAPAETLFRREYKVERFAHSIQRHCGTVRTPIATPDRSAIRLVCGSCDTAVGSGLAAPDRGYS